jgi:gliding motility-associated-like protein
MKAIIFIILSCFYIINLKGQEIIVSCSDKSIRKIDLTNFSSTIYCYTSSYLWDIAINPIDNKLYGLNGSNLVEVDITTGNTSIITINTSWINSWSFASYNALTFDSIGNLYTMNSYSDVLFKIDLTIYTITPIGSCGTGIFSAGDLTFYNGNLYLSGDTSLVKIDYNNPNNSTVLGTFPKFYAVDSYGVYEVNPTVLPQTSFLFQSFGSLIDVYGAASYPSYLNRIDIGNDTSLCDGQLLSLNLGLPYSANYLWSNNSTNPFLNVNQPGSFWVEVTRCNSTSYDTINVNYIPSENCIEVLEILPEIKLEVPNVFTPNNDGFNELFTPTISKNIIFMNTSIYNRWGQLIFDSNFLSIGWDGKTTSGIEVPAGTYYWIINYIDINGNEEKIKGYLTLLR